VFPWKIRLRIIQERFFLVGKEFRMASVALPVRLSVSKNLAVSTGLLVLGLVLPQTITHIPLIGNMLSPMHFPVLLCGLICGWQYGAGLGVALPLISSAVFGMPPLVPIGAAMIPELACYGLVAGLLMARLSKNIGGTLLALLGAMIAGRLVWGLASWVVFTLLGSGFTWTAFVNGALLGAWPGIVLQLVLIPVVMAILYRYDRRI
jgi:hypothetical protein